jgi:hypothetical protein
MIRAAFALLAMYATVWTMAAILLSRIGND